MDTFHLKYLKYKNKYNELKNNLIGGANCPRIGFSQHRGECWHDSLSTCLLYSDGLSEHIQSIFDNPSIRIDDIIYRDPSTFKEYLLPINIEPENRAAYLEFAKKYILSLRGRYLNDKLPKLISPIVSSTNDVPKPPPPILIPRRARRDSLSYSLQCVSNIFDIININASYQEVYDDYIHIGTSVHNYIVLETINYFLTSYNTNKFIDSLFIDINNMYKLNNNIEMIQQFNMLKNNIQKAHSIYLNFDNIDGKVGHAVSLITCNNLHYFYDDNHLHYFYDDNHVDEKESLMVEFNWKQELIYRIDNLIYLYTYYTIPQLQALIKTKLSTNNLNILKNVLSDFLFDRPNILNKIYDRPQQFGTIGHEYLKDYNLRSMLLLRLENLPQPIPIFKDFHVLHDYKITLSRFNNKRANDVLKSYIKIIHTNDLFRLFAISLDYNNSINAQIIFDHIINYYPCGINTLDSKKQNLLYYIWEYTMKDKHIILKKEYIRKLIKANIDFTNKNTDGETIFQYTNSILDEEKRANDYVIDTIDYLEKTLVKHLIKISSLPTFYEYLKKVILKYRNNKTNIAQMYIRQYMAYNRNFIKSLDYYSIPG